MEYDILLLRNVVVFPTNVACNLNVLLYHTHTIPILSTSIQHLTEFVSKNDLISLGSPNPSDVAPGLKKNQLDGNQIFILIGSQLNVICTEKIIF